MPPTTIAALLDVARDLASQSQFSTVRGRARQSQLALHLISRALDQLPSHLGGELSIMIGRVRLCIAEVSSGRTRYKPLLRYTLKRLIVLLERQVVVEVS